MRITMRIVRNHFQTAHGTPVAQAQENRQSACRKDEAEKEPDDLTIDESALVH
jgi:hypothetical protein